MLTNVSNDNIISLRMSAYLIDNVVWAESVVSGDTGLIAGSRTVGAVLLKSGSEGTVEAFFLLSAEFSDTCAPLRTCLLRHHSQQSEQSVLYIALNSQISRDILAELGAVNIYVDNAEILGIA